MGWSGTNGQILRNNANVLTVHTSSPVALGSERAYKNNGSTFTSGATQPTFPAGNGATVADSTGTWTEVTGKTTDGWNSCWARMEFIGSQRMTASTDTAFVGDNHQQTQRSAGLALGTSSGNVYYNFVSMDHTIASPGAGDLLAGANLNFNIAALAITSNFTLNGFTISNAGSGNGTVTFGNNTSGIRFDNCTFTITNTGGQYVLGGGASQEQIILNNCTVNTSGTNVIPLRTGGARIKIRGGTMITASTFNLFSSAAGALPGEVSLDNVDMSGVGGPNLVSTSLNRGVTFRLTRCKLPNATFLTGAVTGVSFGTQEIYWYGCDNGTDQESHGMGSYGGTQVDDKTVVRTGGAGDSLATYSEKIVTGTGATFMEPFECIPMNIWSATTAANRTIYPIRYC
jgi:hypothetical protein